jgi:predicted DNA-binding protein with PD1-like motif
MKIKKIKNIFVLVFYPNEEITQGILKFARLNKIKSGFFYGFGATNNCILGFYNQKSKDYEWKKIKNQLEIGSIIGNLTYKNKKHFLHIHSVLGNKKFNFCGHIKEITAFPTCEILFLPLAKKIERKYNKKTNLFLIN